MVWSAEWIENLLLGVLRDIRSGEVSAGTMVDVGNLNVIGLLAVLHNKGHHLLAALNAEGRCLQHTPVCDEGDR